MERDNPDANRGSRPKREERKGEQRRRRGIWVRRERRRGRRGRRERRGRQKVMLNFFVWHEIWLFRNKLEWILEEYLFQRLKSLFKRLKRS